MEIHKEYEGGFTLTVDSSPSEVVKSISSGSDLYGTIKRVYSVQNGKEVNHWTFKVEPLDYIEEYLEQTLEDEIAMMELFENDD
ncbi:MAG: hypothetical protein WC358_12430, partial [Ignavibacteria bacterium]